MKMSQRVVWVDGWMDGFVQCPTTALAFIFSLIDLLSKNDE